MSRIFPAPGVDGPMMRRPPGATLLLEALTDMVADNAPPNVKRLICDFRDAVGVYYDVHGHPPTWEILSQADRVAALRLEVEALTAQLEARAG